MYSSANTSVWTVWTTYFKERLIIKYYAIICLQNAFTTSQKSFSSFQQYDWVRLPIIICQHVNSLCAASKPINVDLNILMTGGSQIYLNSKSEVWTFRNASWTHCCFTSCRIRGLTLGYLRACQEWEQMVGFICSFYKCILSRFFCMNISFMTGCCLVI